MSFPLVPLFGPLKTATLLRMNEELSLMTSVIFAFFGTLLIVLWASQLGDDDSYTGKLARTRTQEGFFLIGLAAVVAVLGLYLLAPIAAAIVGYILWALVHGFRVTFVRTQVSK